jgi:glycosyltransferase involved in cell wall biosynthesis
VKRVLVVALHFPPVGGAAVQRNAKFVRYLRDFWWEPVVLTSTAPPRGRWTPRDDSLLAEIPDDVEVVRVPVSDEEHVWRDRAARALARPEGHERAWGAAAEPKIVELSKDVDVIYGSLVPYGTAAAVGAASRASGRPWVADLQDPWALDDTLVHPTRLHRYAARARMRRALESASRIVMNTTEAMTRTGEAFPSLRSRLQAIPNGFDPADFQPAVPTVADGAFRIVHTGYLHTDVGHQTHGRLRSALGGLAEGVNIMTRSHLVLLEALDLLRAAQPGLASRVELHLAGVLSEQDVAAVEGRDDVVLHGYLSHREATALMQTASLLFLPMHDLPPGERAVIVPGKTYEYLGSGRPILAAVPDGDARDLLAQAGALLCRPSDARGIATALESALREQPTGTNSAPVLDAYRRRTLTARLAAVLEEAAR